MLLFGFNGDGFRRRRGGGIFRVSEVFCFFLSVFVGFCVCCGVCVFGELYWWDDDIDDIVY